MRRQAQATGQSSPPRSGAVMVEGAIVLSVFLTILLASFDFSLAVLIDNSLADAARRLAREAIVHGGGSSSPWGPTSFEGSADGNSEYAETIRDFLIVVDPADVLIGVEWPDGGNQDGHRVEVRLTSEYPAILSALFGSDPYLLHATSTMRIEP